MPDQAHLDWPFFEDTHRALAVDIATWARGSLPAEEAEDVDAACRDLVTVLGRAGWLRYCVPAEFGGVLPELDSRVLCLLRETLAYQAGLADFSFAMQGLGSGAITLYGSPEMKERYLPRVASGEWIAAFALSEPEAG